MIARCRSGLGHRPWNMRLFFAYFGFEDSAFQLRPELQVVLLDDPSGDCYSGAGRELVERSLIRDQDLFLVDLNVDLRVLGLVLGSVVDESEDSVLEVFLVHRKLGVAFDIDPGAGLLCLLLKDFLYRGLFQDNVCLIS